MDNNRMRKLRIKNELSRALLGEFLGTTILVLIIGCVCAQAVIPKPAQNEMININVGVGLAVAFGVAICAKVSGGHINPAVSLMFLTFRQINVVRFVLYALVQLAGAFIGAALTFLIYRDAINTFDKGIHQVYGTHATAHIFASYPATHLGVFSGLLDQIFATAVFCLFIAHITDKRNHYPSWIQPYLIGTVVVMIGTAFAYNAGYALNPARDLGPRIFSLIVGYGWEVFSFNDYCWFWIPILGPLIGAVLGAWVYQLAIGVHIPVEAEYEVVTQEVNQQVNVTGAGGGVVKTFTTTTTRELQPLTPAKEQDGAGEP